MWVREWMRQVFIPWPSSASRSGDEEVTLLRQVTPTFPASASATPWEEHLCLHTGSPTTCSCLNFCIFQRFKLASLTSLHLSWKGHKVCWTNITAQQSNLHSPFSTLSKMPLKRKTWRMAMAATEKRAMAAVAMAVHPSASAFPFPDAAGGPQPPPQQPWLWTVTSRPVWLMTWNQAILNPCPRSKGKMPS